MVHDFNSFYYKGSSWGQPFAINSNLEVCTVSSTSTKFVKEIGSLLNGIGNRIMPLVFSIINKERDKATKLICINIPFNVNGADYSNCMVEITLRCNKNKHFDNPTCNLLFQEGFSVLAWGHRSIVFSTLLKDMVRNCSH